MDYFMLFVLAFLSFLLIVVVLLQRGRGGGLAGALGGAGGQSAFGTKSGDVFTKITIGLVIVWVLVSGISILVLSASAEKLMKDGANVTPEVSNTDKEGEGKIEEFPLPEDRPALKPDATDDKSQKPETTKKEPVKVTPPKTETPTPTKTESPKEEPAKTEPAKTEPAKTEPAKPATAE